MTLIREGRIELEFPKHWCVIKYDDSAAYRHHACRHLQGTKAVDIVALDPTPSRPCLYFIELKDFRGHAIENRLRLNPNKKQEQESVFHEIGEKVRDTLAGIIGALRVAGGDWPDCLAPIVAHVAGADREVAVVAWIEEDYASASVQRASLSTYDRELARKVRWLTTTYMVASIAINPLAPHGVVCRSS